MPSPFPGMDPYLESPDIWPDVHHRMISEIQASLNPTLRPHYVARVELRVYITGEEDPGFEVIIPDVRIEASGKNGGRKAKQGNGASVAVAEPEVIPFLFDDDEIKEAYLEIRRRDSGALVTIIELMSPANKIRGAHGRDSFMEKRRSTVGSDVNWVEIDLLRAGIPSASAALLGPSDYRVLMYRAKQRRGHVWRITLRQALPTIGIPLRGKDADVPLDLGAVLNAAYDHAAYDLSIDYGREPAPPLVAADRKWADKLLRERGLR